MEKILVGLEKDGTAPVIKKENGRLIRGLRFSNGDIRWFPAPYVGDFFCGAAVYEEGETGVIDRQGDFIFEPEFEVVEDFNENRAFASRGDSTVLLDNRGNILKSWDDNFITSGMHNGVARISRFRGDNRTLQSGYVDRNGEWIIRMIEIRKINDIHFLVDSDDWYSDGLLRVCREGKYGFIDLNCTEIVPCIYKNASRFDSGLAAVSTGDGYGYINIENEFVIQPNFQFALPFYRGIALARKDGMWYALTPDGEIISRCMAENMSQNIPGCIIYSKAGLYGLMDYSFSQIFPAKYGVIIAYRDGILTFSKNNHRGYADLTGNELICDMSFAEEISVNPE